MKQGQRVRLKLLATNTDSEFRGLKGTVVYDNAPGELVRVRFDDEALTHQFLEEDLESTS